MEITKTLEQRSSHFLQYRKQQKQPGLALELLNNVEKLTQTAGVLDDNMNGLKTKINAFTIE